MIASAVKSPPPRMTSRCRIACSLTFTPYQAPHCRDAHLVLQQGRPSIMQSAADALEQITSVSPALARYTSDTIVDNLWKNDVLPARDRSLVTVAAMIQRGQPIELVNQIELALDNGVSPAE